MKILNSTEDMLKGLTAEFLIQINKRVRQHLTTFNYKVKEVLKNRLVSAPEFAELSSPSETTALFGFPVGTEHSIANAIVTELLNETVIKFEEFRMFGRNIKGKVVIEMNWGNVLNSNVAHIITEKGYKLPFLEWLTVWGDRIFVDEYTFLYRPNKTFKGSRSEHGLMIKGNARAVRVDPNISGVYSDNWITRSFNMDSTEEIMTILLSLIK